MIMKESTLSNAQPFVVPRGGERTTKFNSVVMELCRDYVLGLDGI